MAAAERQRPSEAIEDYAKAIYSLAARATGPRPPTRWPSVSA